MRQRDCVNNKDNNADSKLPRFIYSWKKCPRDMSKPMICCQPAAVAHLSQ